MRSFGWLVLTRHITESNQTCARLSQELESKTAELENVTAQLEDEKKEKDEAYTTNLQLAEHADQLEDRLQQQGSSFARRCEWCSNGLIDAAQMRQPRPCQSSLSRQRSRARIKGGRLKICRVNSSVQRWPLRSSRRNMGHSGERRTSKLSLRAHGESHAEVFLGTDWSSRRLLWKQLRQSCKRLLRTHRSSCRPCLRILSTSFGAR